MIKIVKQNILVLGFGREGQSSLRYLLRNKEKNITVFDEKNLKDIDQSGRDLLRNCHFVEAVFGKTIEEAKGFLSGFDVVIKSAGIAAGRLSFLKKNTILTSPTNLFFEKCPGKIIGVTGTKGKSTTSSLIYEILKSCGRKTILLGNIGRPCLDYLPQIKKDTVVVYEMSSHQLATIYKSPHVAVFLNFFPEHLDYYKNVKEYLLAKANITKFQTRFDYLIFNAADKTVERVCRQSRAVKIPFGRKKIKSVISRLPGDFNQRNIEAAVLAAEIFDVPKNCAYQAVKNFKPLAHRLENVGIYRGITFINDSLATIPQASIEAVRVYKNDLQTLITGGFDRHLSYREFACAIADSRIETLIVFPTTGEKIVDELKKITPNRVGQIKICHVNNMKDAVRMAYENTLKEKICLLSCASASFNLFRDYADRGGQFKKYIKEYGL